jgi:tripartite ATP-independent transporter DctP family solute receptor
VIAGDIDMDIQGASALSAVYGPMSAVDGAFVFDDSDHMYNFFTSEASDPLKQGFEEETGVHILGAWNTGARQFTANVPIRSPEDLAGLRMRFPPSPQFLMNAAAMGAEPVEVAFEELYLALQQGTVDGQENPITNIDAISLVEVQDYISLSSHQLSSNLVIIGEVWNELSAEQQAALTAAVETAMVQEPQCAADAEEEILAEWRDTGAIEIVDDVDREAFRELAEPYLRENFTPEQVEVLEAIRSTAD